jgi:molecular chaperone DnaK
MKQAAEEHAEEDKQVRERIETLNKADSLLFSTKKQLDENKDKISEENQTKIQEALDKLEELHKEEKVEEIDDAIDELNNAWAAASQEIYQAAEAEQQAGAQPGADAQDGAADAEGSEEDDAVDADFEVVDDEDEKK